VYRFLTDAADVGAVLADGTAVGEEKEVGIVFDEVVTLRTATEGSKWEQEKRESQPSPILSRRTHNSQAG
jgi:hypothetical protein